jgi:hypothetical protein
MMCGDHQVGVNPTGPLKPLDLEIPTDRMIEDYETGNRREI